MLKSFKAVLCFAVAALAQANGSSPCADLQQAYNRTDGTYPASEVVSCMQTVPFNKNNDARKFWNKFQAVMQFHSDTVWLKDPPSSYQQPAMDLNARIANISSNIDNNKYSNQWDFEMDVVQLLHDTHNGHVFLSFGLSDKWSFLFPQRIIPVSIDGVSLPKLYTWDLHSNLSDFLSQVQSNLVSPLSQINGQSAVDFLTNASKTIPGGNLETHADWNALFITTVGLINGQSDQLSNAPASFGVDSFEFTWENGTTAEYEPRARFSTGPQLFANLTSPDVWYNSFVVDQSSLAAATTTSNLPSLPTESVASTVASQVGGATTTGYSASPTTTASSLKKREQFYGWSNKYVAYPLADVIQDQFGQGAQLSGYFFSDVSLGVLSIPTFDTDPIQKGNAAETFSKVFADFITGAKSAGMKKILIDARSNGGGTGALSTELFDNFFPQFTAWSGSRMKISPALNALGASYTHYWLSQSPQQKQAQESLFASQWVATNYLNPATGVDFGSWSEIQQGSYIQKGDNFTPTMEFDWADTEFDFETTGEGITIDGFGNRTQNGVPNPWDPSDIVILLDGLCASTCTTFARKFSDVGVKTIAVGGLPQLGAMQGAAGVRGENSYSWNALNANTRFALNTFDTASQLASILPDPKNYFQVRQGSFNLRDQIRPNATFPQQFAYLPADCRIFYTPSTYNNYTNLWKYAAHAIWSDVGTNGSCLPSSTAAAVISSPDATNITNTTSTSSNNATSTGPSSTSPTTASPTKGNTASGMQYHLGLLLGAAVFWIALMA